MIFIVIMVMIVVVVMVMGVRAVLHAFHQDILFDGVAQGIHQIEGDLPFLALRAQCVLHPSIRRAADVDEEVRGGQFYKVLRGGLEIVQINARILQQG